MTTLLLAAFLCSPTRTPGVRPVALSGDMYADWHTYAKTAEACVADRLPTSNILSSWKRLGVRMYKRVAWNPGRPSDWFRRKAGFVAVREGADGAWLEGEEGFSEAWKQAAAEAEKDAEVVLYCKSLAEKAMAVREKDSKAWIEGRRVMWLLRFMDFGSENLDTLRLEFVSYARRIEQLLGLPARTLPGVADAAPRPDPAPFVPLEGENPVRTRVSVDKEQSFRLAEGLAFESKGGEFVFTLSSDRPRKDRWPDVKGRFRLYVPDGEGSYIAYEYTIDLSSGVLPGERAPTDGHGLWFVEERWGRGVLRLYGANPEWRVASVASGTGGSLYPYLFPRFWYEPKKDGKGWTAWLHFPWLPLLRHWPSVRPETSDSWFVSVDIPGVAATACEMQWGKGRVENLAKFVGRIGEKGVLGRYQSEKDLVSEIYTQWHEDRYYDFAKTKEPTYHRFDAATDGMFYARVVEPMMEANEKTVKALPRFGKMPDAEKLAFCKSLEGLVFFFDDVSAARRDYILLRQSGKEPPEPPRKARPKDKEPSDEPVLDDGEGTMQLDEEGL